MPNKLLTPDEFVKDLIAQAEKHAREQQKENGWSEEKTEHFKNTCLQSFAFSLNDGPMKM